MRLRILPNLALGRRRMAMDTSLGNRSQALAVGLSAVASVTGNVYAHHASEKRTPRKKKLTRATSDA